MKLRTKIITLKSVRVVFDILIIGLSLLFLYNAVCTVSTLSVISKTGFVMAKVNSSKAISTDDFEIISKINDVKIKSFVETYNIIIGVNDPSDKTWAVVYTIFYFIAIYLAQLFFIFVLFHIRNIVNSVIKAIKQENKQPFQHNVFTIRNIYRLKYIAIGFILLPLVELIIHVVDIYFIDKYFKIEGYILSTRINIGEVSWDYLLIGILFLVFIEIIRRGITIQEENDLTV